MRSRFRLVLGIVLPLLSGAVAHAQTTAAPALGYRWLDAQGNIHYTQTPPPGSARFGTPGDVAELVDDVLDLAGAKRSIAQIPVQAAAEVRQHRGKLGAGAAEQLAGIVSRAFSADMILSRVRAAIVRQADPQRLATLLEFLSSPLSRQMTELEMDATSPEGLAGMRAFAERLRTSKPPEARLALVRRLDAVSGTSELSVDAAVAILRSMAQVADATAPPEKRSKPGEIEAVLNKTRAALSDTTRVATVIQLLYAYRSVGDQEVGDYVAFWESDPARWFAQVFHRAFVEAVSASATAAAEEMTRTFSQRSEARP